jgi:RNA polymerase sigma factor (sigma-70 family)
VSGEALSGNLPDDFRTAPSFERLPSPAHESELPQLAEILESMFSRYFKKGCQAAIAERVPPDQAEDLVIEAMLRVATQICDGRLEDPEAHWPYLRMVIHNIWVNLVRQDRRSITVNEVPDKSTVSAESIVLGRRMIADIDKCIQDMPEKWAAVLRAVCFEGKTHAQIAEDLGISRGYVEQLLHRARARFTKNWSHLRSTHAG